MTLPSLQARLEAAAERCANEPYPGEDFGIIMREAAAALAAGQAREQEIHALSAKWRAGAASQTGEYEQCDAYELNSCADELDAILRAAQSPTPRRGLAILADLRELEASFRTSSQTISEAACTDFAGIFEQCADDVADLIADHTEDVPSPTTEPPRTS